MLSAGPPSVLDQNLHECVCRLMFHLCVSHTGWPVCGGHGDEVPWHIRLWCNSGGGWMENCNLLWTLCSKWSVASFWERCSNTGQGWLLSWSFLDAHINFERFFGWIEICPQFNCRSLNKLTFPNHFQTSAASVSLKMLIQYVEWKQLRNFSNQLTGCQRPRCFQFELNVAILNNTPHI